MVLTKTLLWPSVVLRLYRWAAVTESHQSVVTVQKKSVLGRCLLITTIMAPSAA